MDYIKARLPFTPNENSIPTENQLYDIRDMANSFINGYLGRNSDVSSNTAPLAVIETDISVFYAMLWHQNYAPFFDLTDAHKMILDNYRSDTNVSVVDYKFDDY